LFIILTWEVSKLILSISLIRFIVINWIPNNNKKGRKQKSKGGPQTNPLGMINSNSKQNQSKQKANQIVLQPSAMSTKKAMKAPQINYKLDGSCRIRHREYLFDIIGSNAFTSNKVRINPGLSDSFPWLSAIANRYESYLFHRLQFEFCTESPTNEIGTVLLTVDYDPLDPAPSNKTQALAYVDAVRSPPWSDCCFTASVKDLHKRSSYFTRSLVSDTTDLTTKDTGNLFACTQGQGNNRTLGEIWVSYEIELMTPQLHEVATLYQAISTTAIAPLGSLQFVPICSFPTEETGTSAPGSWSNLLGEFTFQTKGRFLLILLGNIINGDTSDNFAATESDLNMNYSNVSVVVESASDESGNSNFHTEIQYSAIIDVVPGAKFRPYADVFVNDTGASVTTGIFLITVPSDFKKLNDFIRT